jgi:hypothetical protein
MNLNKFDKFIDAKKAVRTLRIKNFDDKKNDEFKIIFADNQLSAEEQLHQKHPKPILME